MEIWAALIAGASALGGAIIAGIIAHYSGKSEKAQKWRMALVKDEVNGKEKLYTEFLVEANRLYLASMHEKFNDIRKMTQLGSIIVRIELASSDDVILKAKHLSDLVYSAHSQNGEDGEHTFAELRLAFIDAAKQELEKIKNS